MPQKPQKTPAHFFLWWFSLAKLHKRDGLSPTKQKEEIPFSPASSANKESRNPCHASPPALLIFTKISSEFYLECFLLKPSSPFRNPENNVFLRNACFGNFLFCFFISPVFSWGQPVPPLPPWQIPDGCPVPPDIWWADPICLRSDLVSQYRLFSPYRLPPADRM